MNQFAAAAPPVFLFWMTPPSLLALAQYIFTPNLCCNAMGIANNGVTTPKMQSPKDQSHGSVTKPKLLPCCLSWVLQKSGSVSVLCVSNEIPDDRDTPSKG
jgi:hypothetical protein